MTRKQQKAAWYALGGLILVTGCILMSFPAAASDGANLAWLGLTILIMLAYLDTNHVLCPPRDATSDPSTVVNYESLRRW